MLHRLAAISRQCAPHRVSRSSMQTRTMATFNLPDTSPSVTVQSTHDLTQEQLLSFKPFRDWVSTLQKSLSLQKDPSHTFHSQPYRLRNINVQSVDFFGGERIGFIKLKAEVSNDQGESLPGSVFLRGGSVAMMLILQPDDVDAESEQDKHVILTVQPRIPAGSLAFAELPAGMLDGDSFAGGAAKEIQEETGLTVPESELINLTELSIPRSSDSDEQLQIAFYPSAGGSDEFIPVFMWQKRIPRSQLQQWQGKLTGLRDEGEKITLKITPLEDLWKSGARDAKALAAWALYQGLRKEKKI